MTITQEQGWVADPANGIGVTASRRMEVLKLIKTHYPSIGLALGAGGARGIAHVHVIRALDDLGIRPAAIAGTSIGALMGACYSSGMSGNDIRDLLLERFGHRQAIIASLWKLRGQDIEELIGGGRPRLGEIDLRRILERLLPASLPDHIEHLPIDLQIVASRYYQHDAAVFTCGPLLPALAASAAMPAIFQPVVIDGVVHVDGGMTNPVPFDLLQNKASFIIGVDVSGCADGEESTIPRKIDVLYSATQLLQRAVVKEKLRHMRCDVLLTPKVGAWRALDFLRTDEVLKATEPLFEKTKLEVCRALDNQARHPA